MATRASAQWLPGRKRLHLNDGPIDLIIGADGSEGEVLAAYEAAVRLFETMLDELCKELAELRSQAAPDTSALRGSVARLMYDAVAPFASSNFITPMAAVAGAVADSVMREMLRAAKLRRAYVNNGGDIAIHLASGQLYSLALVDKPALNANMLQATVASHMRIGGVATSGCRGRSFSLGIADAVTVFAQSAAAADAAATIVANAVDLPTHNGIVRQPARSIDPCSDLGDRLVVRDVPELSAYEVECALDAGEQVAKRCVNDGLIFAAVLQLGGRFRTSKAGGVSAIEIQPRANESRAFGDVVKS